MSGDFRDYTWELPQTVLAHIRYEMVKDNIVEVVEYPNCTVYYTKGVHSNYSLNIKVFIKYTEREILEHELAHIPQSDWTGWLFVPLNLFPPTHFLMEAWAEGIKK